MHPLSETQVLPQLDDAPFRTCIPEVGLWFSPVGIFSTVRMEQVEAHSSARRGY